MTSLSPNSTESRASSWWDDLAYILPMAAFLLLMSAGGWWPRLFVASYIARTVVTATLIVIFWRRYTPIRWDYWWLGIIFGIVGIVQWVGVEELLVKFWPKYPRISPATSAFDPHQYFTSPAKMWAFIALRWAGAALIVPVMEELFWRDYLWRTVAAPNNFKLAKVGEWDWSAFLVVVIFCTSVHPQWITALIWSALMGLFIAWTRSLGACIIAHGVTNLLLGLFVQMTGKWYYW